MIHDELHSFFVALAFLIAIVSVWVSKSIGRFRDTGYDEKHLPTQKEWRNVRIGYTIVLVFLGTVFVLLTMLSTST